MLNEIRIDLNSLKKDVLKESSIAKFAAQLKYLFWHLSAPPLFSTDLPSVRVVGSKGDLEKFAHVMGNEKKYGDAYLKYGLNDPKVLKDRIALEKAIYHFERDTGLKWPLK